MGHYHTFVYFCPVVHEIMMLVDWTNPFWFISHFPMLESPVDFACPCFGQVVQAAVDAPTEGAASAAPTDVARAPRMSRRLQQMTLERMIWGFP